MRAKFILLLVVTLFTSNCASPPMPAPTTVPVEITPTELPTPASTAMEQATIQPTIAPIQTPYTPFYVNTIVENLILRANPGALFTAKTTLAQNSRLLVLGIAPGREWIFVQTPFDNTGWVFAELLESNPSLVSAPLMQPADVQLVRGQVLDGNNLPVRGIQYAIIEGVGSTGSPPRTDAMTDENGFFYAFLPVTAGGTWTVSFTAISCKSALMGPTCECLNGNCGKSDPEITTITLPMTDLIRFTWR
jgi:hypothetical protein